MSRYCEYCDSELGENILVCPNCGAQSTRPRRDPKIVSQANRVVKIKEDESTPEDLEEPEEPEEVVIEKHEQIGIFKVLSFVIVSIFKGIESIFASISNIFNTINDLFEAIVVAVYEAGVLFAFLAIIVVTLYIFIPATQPKIDFVINTITNIFK